MEGSRNCLCLAAVILLLSLSNGEEMLRDTQSRQGGTPTSLIQRLFWPLVGPNGYISTLTDTKSEVAKQIAEVAKIRKSIKKYEKACKKIIEKCGNSEECDKECEGELENCRDEVVSCNTEGDNCRDGLIDCKEEKNECQTNNEECTTGFENCQTDLENCQSQPIPCGTGFICSLDSGKCLKRVNYLSSEQAPDIIKAYGEKCATVSPDAVPWRHKFAEIESYTEKATAARSYVENCFGMHPEKATLFFLYNTNEDCQLIYAVPPNNIGYSIYPTICPALGTLPYAFICEYPNEVDDS